MPSRPDLRDIASNVKDAFADADRETLLEILTFVIKEYVVEGPPPMLVHQAETLSDLQNQTFAQLITALQTRCDYPELAMFVVDGEQVGVRIGGVVQPLVPGRQPAVPAAEQLRAAGVRVVETTLAQRPAPPPQQPQPAQPPAPPTQIPGTGTAPPPRGLSIRGAPTGGGGSAPAAAPPQPQPPAAAPQGAPPAPPAAPAPAPGDKPESPAGDDASARFSLLELD